MKTKNDLVAERHRIPVDMPKERRWAEYNRIDNELRELRRNRDGISGTGSTTRGK